MLNKLLREHVSRIVAPIGAGIGATGMTPNMISIGGVFGQAIAALVVASGRPVSGGIALLLAAGFDMLDGAVAKATGNATTGGAFLDSTLDRLADGIAFAGVAWYLADSTWGLGLSLSALVLGFSVSYIRVRAESLGYTCKVGIAERTERVLVLGLGLILEPLGLLVPALAIVSALSLVTVVQRFAHVWRQVKSSEVK